MTNLPAGLIASPAVQAAHAPDAVTSAVLIGVDLGPNLSVTGSLATILLTALRREGQQVGAGPFLKRGLLVMPPALVLAIGAAWLLGRHQDQPREPRGVAPVPQPAVAGSRRLAAPSDPALMTSSGCPAR